MTPIAIVPPVAVLLYPVEVLDKRPGAPFGNWNARVRQFNKGRLR